MTRIMFVYPEVAALPRDALLRGNVRDFLVDERGVAAQWMPAHRGWAVRLTSLPDVIARAEAAGIIVRMRGRWTTPLPAPWHPPRARPSTTTTTAGTVGQLALFDKVGEAS